MLINLGSGNTVPIDGVVNVDIRKVPGVDIVADVRSLPFADNEIEGIFNRNLIEHFGRKEIAPLLKEWFRVLKPGGFIRIETVDGGKTMTRWKDIPEDNLLDAILGAQTYEENFHKMIFTDKILERFLIEAGFEILNIEQFDEREIPRIIIKAVKKLYDPSTMP